jgi:hypothetical protein
MLATTLSYGRNGRRPHAGQRSESETMKTGLRIGDRVSDGALLGKLVANIETGEFSAEYLAEDWAYLKVGVLVMTDEAGLVHYPDSARLTVAT